MSAVGVAGLGLMGGAYARRLIAAGAAPVLWNRDPARAAAFAGTPARRASIPRDLGRACRIVHLALTDASAVERVVFGEAGLLEDAPQGGLVVDHSTIGVAETRAFAARAAARGWRWVDAPVSGGSAGAQAGTLVAFCGGNTADVAEATEAMRAFTRRATHMGGLGAGQATKLVNQLMVGSLFALLAEAVVLAEANGVDAAALPAALEDGFGDSTLLQRQLPRMVAGPGPRQGSAAVMLKDMDLVAALAEASAVATPVSGAAHALWRSFVAAGFGEEDWVGVVAAIRGGAAAPAKEGRQA